MSILHTKTLGNLSKLCKAQTLVQMQSMAIGCNYSIELKDAEAKFSTDFQGVFHQLLTDMKPTYIFFYSITGITDMSAASNIVWMQYISLIPQHYYKYNFLST